MALQRVYPLRQHPLGPVRQAVLIANDMGRGKQRRELWPEE